MVWGCRGASHGVAWRVWLRDVSVDGTESGRRMGGCAVDGRGKITWVQYIYWKSKLET